MEGYHSFGHGTRTSVANGGYAFNHLANDRTVPNAPASTPYKHVDPKPVCNACKDVNPRPAPPVARSWYSGGEMKRKKRIATYKYYAVEGKVKNSFRNGFRWIKKKCSSIVRGY